MYSVIIFTLRLRRLEVFTEMTRMRDGNNIHLRLRRLEVITEMTRMRDVFCNNIHLKVTEAGGDHRDD